MKKVLSTRGGLLLLGLFLYTALFAQTDTLYYLNSSFETPEDQAAWTSLPVHATIKWDYENGGHNYPIAAKSGNENAIFYWSDFGTSYYRNLVSAPIDLSTAEKPQLSFWHAQAAFIGQDELRILLKAGAGQPWDTIAAYTNRLDDWTERVFNIHEIDTKYLTEGFQIGFLGLANGGQGVCLDSVVIKETASINKFVKSWEYDPVNQQIVASEMIGVPMIKLRIEIMGNNGNSKLNSLSFRLSEGDAAFFKTNGFRIYHTHAENFQTRENGSSTQVGPAVSISGDQISFSGLNHDLDLGNNYIWLTADMADDLPHGSTFSFSADANSFMVNDTLLPAGNQNNIKSVTSVEAVFYDNFDATTGWTLENDFEIAQPQGLVIGKSKDPGYAYSGTNALGTDLTVDGAYPYPIGGAYYATSPMIDLTYFDRAKVYMRKWIDFNPLDRASIEFSTDGGNTWTKVWQSQIDNPTASTEWEELLFSEIADEMLSKKDSIRIRFGVLEANTATTRAGFNLDHFAITGNHLETDVGITTLHSPFEDCIGSFNDTVKMVVRNYAEGASPAEIPVFFGLWGLDSTIVRDTIRVSIPQDDSITFVFSELANFPRGDIYDKFIVGIDLEADEDPTNDTLTRLLYIQDALALPASIDFEYKGGVWLPSEESTWQYREPEGSIPQLPESPYSWILSPFGDYRNNDTSYVESNCFDLTGANRSVIEMDYWLNAVAGEDGAAIEYTIDDGETWTLLNTSALGAQWGWYTDMVAALGHEGWTGQSGGWLTVRELLPEALNTEVKVKFRVLWAADGANNARGMAFDNFKVYAAPPDVGVSNIEIPKDTCQFGYPDEMTVWVKNYGYNNLNATDTMIIGYEFENEPAVIDTFQVGSTVIPGDSIAYNLPTSFDVTSPGIYQIRAFTLIEDDPFYYITNNDSLTKSFEIWQNPLTGLADTISSRQPDTLSIEPIFDVNYDYLWGDMTTTPTYDVDNPGTYYLTVTESVHGCQTYDSIYIELLFNDIGITNILPVSSCELTASENIQVELSNVGTDSLITGEKIRLYYELDGGSVIADSITLSSALLSGSSFWFTFSSQTEDLSAEGDYSIKAYTYYGGDTVRTNDTLSQVVTVFGYPELNLGGDTVINGTEYLLNADPSFTAYLWENGDTVSSRLIDTSGYYWLDVIDANGCPATDSIDIWFRIRDVRPLTLVSPISSCNREGLDNVVLTVQNFGSDTITASDEITVSYKLDEQTRVTESMSGITLLPGESANHSFGPTVDLNAFATYSFDLTASTPGDLRPENDTLIDEVVTNTNPVVDLGIEDDDIFYVTELVLDAGYGENYSYIWQDGSTEQTYTVTDITNVEVLVVDTETGCYGGDTAFVYLDILDYVITDISIDANACEGEYDDVQVTLLNNGNLPRGGAEITLDYTLDGNFLFSEVYFRDNNWRRGESYIYTTQGIINLDELGPGTLEIKLSTEGDLRPENDNFIHNMEVVPNPDVDFGGDAIEVGEFPYTLDAGSGHQSYLWSTGATTSTLEVTEAGNYSVTVTGTNGCQTIQSVYVDDELAVSPGAEDQLSVSVYPNPASEYITIEAMFEDPGNYVLEIFNAQNTIVHEEGIETYEFSEEFYVGDLPPGIYFIRFRKGSIYHISKMIIQ